MPRKRKVDEEAGLRKTEHDISGEESAAKTVPKSPKPATRRTGSSSKKAGSRPPKSQVVPRASATDAAQVLPSQSARTSPASEPSAAAHDREISVRRSPVSLEEQIAVLAYSYWEARGRQDGNSQEDWFRAEQEILSRLRAAKPKGD